MSTKTATFETTCPTCGEKIRVVADEKQVADGKVSVPAKCQRCLGQFEAITDLDCLEWDDACKTEVGRFG